MWIITVLVIIYSIAGFLLLKDYNKQCGMMGLPPFGGKMYKVVGASLFSGGITTILLMYSVISVIFEFFRERKAWKQRQKDEEQKKTEDDEN